MVSYENIFMINVNAFKAIEQNINAYATDNWTEFRELTNFSESNALFSNERNPIYTELSEEALNLVAENHYIYPLGFIRLVKNGLFSHQFFVKIVICK